MSTYWWCEQTAGFDHSSDSDFDDNFDGDEEEGDCNMDKCVGKRFFVYISLIQLY